MTREEAIYRLKALLTMCDFRDAFGDRVDDKLYEDAVAMAIEALKEHKTGKWINCKYPLGECSECNAIVDIQNNEANYCPVCGSKNRGEEDGCY